MMEYVCPATTWAWLFVAAAGVQWVLALILSPYYRRSRAIRWLQAFCVAGGITNISAAILGCTGDPITYTAMANLRNLSAIASVVFLIIFAIHFVNKGSWFNHFAVSAGLFWLSFLMIWLTMGGRVFYSDIAHAQYVTWGYRTFGSGPLAWIALAYFGLGLLTPVLILNWYVRRIDNPEKRREINIVHMALMAPVLVGLVGEIILPFFSHQPAFPFSTIVSTVSLAVITYAVIRFGLRLFNVNDVLSDVTDIMPGGVIIMDHTLTIQYANQNAAELLGYEKGKLSGMSAKKFFRTQAALQQFEVDIVAPLRRTTKVVVPDTSLLGRRGDAVPVTINASRIQANDDFGNIVLVATNIAPLKEAELALAAEKTSVEHKVRERTHELAAAQAEFLASVRGLPFGFGLVNAAGEVAFHNSLFAKFLGRKIPMGGAASRIALAEIDAQLGDSIHLSELIEQAQTKRQPLEKRVEVGPRFFRFYFSPVLAESKRQVLGCVLIVEDLSEAMAQERSRNEFFSIASHELRTPLTAIRGNAEIMKDYFPEISKNPELTHMVDDMFNASGRLIRIVNDFLDASRLEQGRISYRLENFDIATVINLTMRELDTSPTRHDLALTGDDPAVSATVYADAERTRQVLVNLIGNGFKYTPKGGVTVHTTVLKHMVKISVTDTGVGIPMESQHLLFHKFQQTAENILTRDATQSTGLGLYIAKLMAEGMGGKLYLESSEVGKGTTFCVELPQTA